MNCLQGYGKNIVKTIISGEDIQQKVKETGKILSEKYDGKPLLLVSILKGSFIFLADICRALTEQTRREM